jgi:hypothetical protein
MAHTIFNSSDMTGTKLTTKLRSVKIPTDLDNGSVVKVGALAAGEHDVFVASKPAKDTPLNSIAIVDAPEVMADEHKKNLNEFYNVSGSICRAYIPVSGDQFGITAAGLTGTPAIGNAVELAADYKMSTAATATAGSTQIGSIIDKQGDYFIVCVA